MADKLTSCVQQIIDFSKMVPGFMQLLQDDQITLLKSGSYGIMLLYATQCYIPERNSFIYNQQLISVDFLLSFLMKNSGQQQTTSLTLDDDERYFLQENLDFIRQLKQFNLSNTELALLSALILFNPENSGLNDQKIVYRNHQKFIELLRMDIENNRNHISPSSLEKQQMLQQILNLVSVNLRRLTQLHFELIKSFKIKNTQIEFPPLHRELFNVDYYVYCHQQQQLQIQQQQISVQNNRFNQSSNNQCISNQQHLPQNATLSSSSSASSSSTQQKQNLHENILNSNILSPSPSSCSSSSSVSNLNNQHSPPPSNSNSSNQTSLNNFDHNNQSNSYNYNLNSLKSSTLSNVVTLPTNPMISNNPKSIYFQNGTNGSSSSSSSTTSTPSNTNQLTNNYSNTLDFVQTLDDVIMNNCNNVNETHTKGGMNMLNNNSPSSTSVSSASSVSPPSYASLSSTYASLIKSEQMFNGSNAMSIGIE